MSKKSNLICYEEYLNTLNKKDLELILNALEIEHNKNGKKQELINIIMEELDDIIGKTLSYFTMEEYRKLKLVVKKRGNVRIRTDVSLMQFCENLVDRHLMFKLENKKYVLFKEVYKLFKIKIKQKRVIKKCQKNSDELQLILGTTLVYGAINLDNFYKIYSEKYEISINDLKNYLISLKKYGDLFTIYEDKDELYIASKKIKNVKLCKKYADGKEIANYSASDIQNLYTLNYMKKYRSYRILKKFLTDSYYIEKGNYIVVVEKILNPFLEENQVDKKKANKLLDQLIDDYFEFSSQKNKEKLVNLVNNITYYYPNWNLYGYSEKEKEK